MKLAALGIILALATIPAESRLSANVYPCPPSGALRLPHSWSCSSFVQCVNGIAVEQDCSEGLHYSADQGFCTTPESANCDVEQATCPRWTDPEDLTYVMDGRNCSQYFMCFNGDPLPLQCGPGLTFNELTKQCDTQTCSTSSLSCGDAETRVIANENDCSRFFRCSRGVLYSATCRDGFAFDSVSLRCVRGNQATCAQPVTTTVGTTVITEPPFNANDYCIIDQVGRLAEVSHPHRCDWFISCVIGTGYIGRCGWQSIFNPELERCVTGDPDTCEFGEETWTPMTTNEPLVTGGPDFNIDDFCNVNLVGSIATVAHPQRCDWFISCVVGRGSIGRCGWQSIFNSAVGRCVDGDSDTCEFTES